MMTERLRVVQTLPPQGEPLHLDDAKVHCREESTAADVDITAMIPQARQLVEMWSGRQLVCATWKLYLDAFPTEIRVPFPPLREVSSISYVDSNGTTQTLATTEYTVDTNQEPARIVEAYSKSWPVTRYQVNAVTVTFIAGYVVPFTGATSDVLEGPESDRRRQLHAYEQRWRLGSTAGGAVGQYALLRARCERCDLQV
jgi:uncharacterized phiE125 gp8 family phage protein